MTGQPTTWADVTAALRRVDQAGRSEDLARNETNAATEHLVSVLSRFRGHDVAHAEAVAQMLQAVKGQTAGLAGAVDRNTPSTPPQQGATAPEGTTYHEPRT